MILNIPVSAGELVDKITILEIKSKRIKENYKLKAIHYELKMLSKEYDRICKKIPGKMNELNELKHKLYNINNSLWRAEDKIRILESKKKFNRDFIKSARDIYIKNDKRSMIKNKINLLTGSELHDIKHYEKY
jgi:hypothetical protein